MGGPQKAPLCCQHTRQFRACSRAGCWVVTESDNTLLAVQHNACACGCLLTGRGEYHGEDSFKNSLLSIPVVVIYYIYLFHHLLLSFLLDSCRWGGWLPLGKGTNSNRRRAAAAWSSCHCYGPAGGCLTLLITNTPVKWLDWCCSETVNSSPWHVSFTIMWIIYFRSFSFNGPDSPTDKWAVGLCRKYCPNIAQYWPCKGDGYQAAVYKFECLKKAFLLALSVVDGVLASPEFSQWTQF